MKARSNYMQLSREAREKVCQRVEIDFDFWFELDEEVATGFLANSSKPITSRHSNENRSSPIKTRNYMQLTQSAGKRVRAGCHWFWPYFWLDAKVARIFQAHLVAQKRKTSFISTLEWKTLNTALNKHKSDKYRIMTASFPKPPKNVLHSVYIICRPGGLHLGNLWLRSWVL